MERFLGKVGPMRIV